LKIGNIIVLGLGISGRAAVRLALIKGFKVCAFDERTSPELEDFERASQDERLKLNLEWKNGALPDAELIVISPGISNSSPLGKAAISSGIPIISELEFGFRFCKIPILAITGTNGKTTTTELTCHLLNSIGRKSAVSGNIGIPLSESVLEQDKYDFLIVETSSFQLDAIADFAPQSAVLLNITSDHMNRYETEKDYAYSKFSVFKNIKSPANKIIRSDLLPYWNDFFPGAGKPVRLSCSDETAEYYFDRAGMLNIGGKAFIRLSETQLLGAHNAENLMAALALVFSVVPAPPINLLKKGICEFRTGQHRLEIVKRADGITYVNDSKATNVNSCWYALQSMKTPVVLILGGTDKGNDYSEIEELVRTKVKGLIFMGLDNSPLHTFFDGKVANIKDVQSMEDAVNVAYKMANEGDSVLLSPCCASFDLFKNYEDRGKQFKNCVRNL
jgi:UDP-N-acetylmuramoylalanine--D-glutamate ligase